MSSATSSPHVEKPASLFSVLIADDHPIVRHAFRSLLETSPALSVVGEAADGEETLAKIAELRPDVALVDIAMPKMSGIEVARRTAAGGMPTRILLLTALEDHRTVREALAAGAAGYVPKSAAATDLIFAIHSVCTGNPYLHPRTMQALIGALPTEVAADANALSAREEEVIRLVALGFSNKEIGVQLSISVKTVETYKARGMEKISASSRADIVRYAAKRGWFANAGQ